MVKRKYSIQKIDLGINKLKVDKSKTLKTDKRFDTKGKPSVNDIQEAINLLIRKPPGSDSYAWVVELFPVKYPSGHAIIERESDGKRKLFQHDYTYENGVATLSVDYKEIKDTYTVEKKYEVQNNKYEALTYNSPEDFVIDGVQIKKGEELHYILGVVLEPESVDATQTEKSFGDIYSEEEVRKAAHNFMANYNGRGNDLMHSNKDNPKLKIVESYIAPSDMAVGEAVVRKGTWMMATLVLEDSIWESVKKGEITGYSIGGYSDARLEGV